MGILSSFLLFNIDKDKIGLKKVLFFRISLQAKFSHIMEVVGEVDVHTHSEKLWLGLSTDNDKALELAKSLHISPKLSSLLVQRGISSYEQAFQFFRPNLNHLHLPFLMKGMERALDRIHEALQKEEKILLFGDYDVDGTTSVALLYRFFSSFYHKIQYYIPSREKEGYGISRQGIDWAISQNISLIIALDCGIKSLQEIEFANQMKIDFIICDHHLPDVKLPEAWAILNPKQEGCLYPFKYLSGCGIAFKLAQAYEIKFSQKEIPFPTKTDSLIDLVALSIACDMVEVNGENRVLAYFGLKKLNANPLIGIRELLKVSRKNHHYTDQEPSAIGFQEILFQLGPRINAAGRMGDASRVIQLLTTDDAILAQSICQDLNQENNRRKEIEVKITEEALEMINLEIQNLTPKKTIRYTNVLFHPNWHKGLIGIVASRVIEQYHAPTIIFTESNGRLTGSARSVGNFNIYDAIQDCEKFLDQFGGHAAAAGVSLLPENLIGFKEAFETSVRERLHGDPLKPRLHFHEEIQLAEITPSFYKILEQFAPFGPTNLSPVFLSRGIRMKSEAQKIGGKHLKLQFCNKSHDSISSIGFGLGNLADHLHLETSYDILYQIEMNTFRGKDSLQLLLKDIKPSLPYFN